MSKKINKKIICSKEQLFSQKNQRAWSIFEEIKRPKAIDKYAKKCYAVVKMETIKSQKNFGKEEKESQGNNSPGRLFMIYKSKTSHPNYDFHLEMEDPETGKNVFVSWAVPKNLPTIPEEKHLAIRIGDHRVEQLVADNENVQGEFSEGDIEIWDKGKWGLMKGNLAGGRLSFNLFGEKLKGRYQMVLARDFGKKEVDDGKIKKDVNWLIWKREVGVFF